jgi:peptidoglycan/LPS O-acetylase OafA/YrhL
MPGFSGGYIGVDIFFVLSGFLITGLIVDGMEKGTFSLAHFYERRARRILPALFAMCLLATIAAWFLFMPADYRSFARSEKGLAYFASNFVFAKNTGYFTETALIKPLLHTWSLAVEEQFYVLFPLLLSLIFFLREKLHTTLFALVGGLLLVSLGLNLALVHSAPEKTFYLLPTRAWELLMGSLVTLSLRRKILPGPALAEKLSFIGVALILYGIVFYDSNTVFPGFAAIIPVAGAALILWTNTPHTTQTGRILSLRAPVAIGLISYGLYLYHWPVLVFAHYYLDRPLETFETLIALAGIFALAAASYKWIETPIRSGAVLKKRAHVFIVSAISLGLMAAAGIAGTKTHGFPSRFSGEVLQYAKGAGNAAPGNGGCGKLVQPENLNAQTVCKIGDPSARPDFLVWGDSHASALAPAIRKIVEDKKLSGWMVTYDGCPALLNVRRTDTRIDTNCEEAGRKVLALIKDNSVKNVLMISRWDIYAFGGEDGGVEDGKRAPLVFAPKDGPEQSGAAGMKSALTSTLEGIRNTGAEPWAMRQVPPHLATIPTALAKAVYFGRNPDDLARPYPALQDRLTFLDETLAQSQVGTITPADLFCPDEGLCLVAHNKTPLYSDNNHVSVYGALWAESLFAPFFDTLR